MSAAANTKASQSPFLEYTPKSVGDVVDNAVMDEITRRLRFSALADSGPASLALGFGGASVSEASGNQAQSDNGGIFVPLGAGLGVEPGQGLTLTADNKIKLISNRVVSQSFEVSADGVKTFTLPESMERYEVSVIAHDTYGTAKFYVSSKSAEAVSVTVFGYSVAFTMVVTCIEVQ